MQEQELSIFQVSKSINIKKKAKSFMPTSSLGVRSTLLCLTEGWDLSYHGNPWYSFYLHLRGRVGSCWGHSSSNLHRWHSCHRGLLGSSCHFLFPSLTRSSATCWASPPPSAFPAQLCKGNICKDDNIPRWMGSGCFQYWTPNIQSKKKTFAHILSCTSPSLELQQ